MLPYLKTHSFFIPEGHRDSVRWTILATKQFLYLLHFQKTENGGEKQKATAPYLLFRRCEAMSIIHWMDCSAVLVGEIIRFHFFRTHVIH